MITKYVPIALVLIASVLTPAAANDACDSACLRSGLDRYMQAMIKHDARAAGLSERVRYTENGAVTQVGEGLWRKASSLGSYDYRLVDPVSQQAMFIGIVNEENTPTIATVRLGIEAGRVAEVEHVVARKGSHALFAPNAFVEPHATFRTPLQGAKLTREKLIEVADTYFVGIERHDSKVILADDECQRIENGVQTTNQPGRTSRNCAHSADLLTYIKAVNDRRYPIVDVEHGVVVSTILFDIPGEATTGNSAQISADRQVAARPRQPRTLLLTEWFKIDHGKIQHIEAIMHNLPHGSRSGWER